VISVLRKAEEAPRAKLGQDRARIELKKIDPGMVEAFCLALKERFADPASDFGKVYLRLVVDEIRLEGRELQIRGSYALRSPMRSGFGKEKKLGKVPSFVRD
jgi:site-specific DNA recombinase